MIIFCSIFSYGFERPSPISKAIRPVITGRDVIAQAQVVWVKQVLLLLEHLVVWMKM